MKQDDPRPESRPTTTIHLTESVPTPSDMLLAELRECRRLGRAIRHARRLQREEAGR